MITPLRGVSMGTSVVLRTISATSQEIVTPINQPMPDSMEDSTRN